jgi:hypothetical protein
MDLVGNSQINYPEVRPSSLLSKMEKYMPKPTQEKDSSKIGAHCMVLEQVGNFNNVLITSGY